MDVVEPVDQSDIMSQKQSISNNTISTSSAYINIVIGFQSNASTSENSEISVSFDSALPCSSKSILHQNRVTLKELAMVCVRYEESDKAGAAIASATLKAFGIVTEEDKRYVVDRSKFEEKGKNTKKKLETRSNNYLN